MENSVIQWHNFYRVLEQNKLFDKDKALVDKLKENHGDHLHEIGLHNLENNKNDLIYHKNISDCIIDKDYLYLIVHFFFKVGWIFF